MSDFSLAGSFPPHFLSDFSYQQCLHASRHDLAFIDVELAGPFGNLGFLIGWPVGPLFHRLVSQVKLGRDLGQAQVFLIAKAVDFTEGDRAPRLHFVTHSLGGTVLRQYLKNSQPGNLGRAVMLAPPNRGSELVDRLKSNGLFRMFTGPAAQQLGTELSALPRHLGPVAFDLGVIAGDRSLNPLFSAWIPGPDDGKVSVASTYIEGMRDFRLVHIPTLG